MFPTLFKDDWVIYKRNVEKKNIENRVVVFSDPFLPNTKSILRVANGPYQYVKIKQKNFSSSIKSSLGLVEEKWERILKGHCWLIADSSIINCNSDSTVKDVDCRTSENKLGMVRNVD
jgi:hypothetical protein